MRLPSFSARAVRPPLDQRLPESYLVAFPGGADNAILACTGGFTQGVYEFVRDQPIELIDDSDLVALSESVYVPNWDIHGPRAGLMARAVAGVGGDAAPDATAEADTIASGLGLAPVTSERDAGGRTVPQPVACQGLPADPAREARQAVIGPAARQARGVLELDQAAAASRAGRGHGAGP